MPVTIAFNSEDVARLLRAFHIDAAPLDEPDQFFRCEVQPKPLGPRYILQTKEGYHQLDIHGDKIIHTMRGPRIEYTTTLRLLDSHRGTLAKYVRHLQHNGLGAPQEIKVEDPQAVGQNILNMRAEFEAVWEAHQIHLGSGRGR